MKRLGIIMDDIASINVRSDTSFALLLEAQKRDYQIHYMQLHDLFLRGSTAYAQMKQLKVIDRPDDYYQLDVPSIIPLHQLDLLLMRKNPPVNEAFWHMIYMLELAEKQGLRVVNKPNTLRDIHEKISILEFSDYCPPTLVTANYTLLNEFVTEQGKVVLKPLNFMGGHGILYVENGDPNLKSMWELISHYGKLAIMAQRFIPDVLKGDKRILLVHGEPVPYALVRVPKLGEVRANLAVGGSAHVAQLTQDDRKICQSISKKLANRGLGLIGLDVIGDYLTEINITSPTGIRQLEYEKDLSICSQFFDYFR